MWSECLCRIYLFHKDQWRSSANTVMKRLIPSDVGNIWMTGVLFCYHGRWKVSGPGKYFVRTVTHDAHETSLCVHKSQLTEQWQSVQALGCEGAGPNDVTCVQWDIHHRINFLKPTSHVIHQQFNIQQLYVLPTLCLCVLYLSESKQRLVPLTS